MTGTNDVVIEKAGLSVREQVLERLDVFLIKNPDTRKTAKFKTNCFQIAEEIGHLANVNREDFFYDVSIQWIR